MKYISRYDTSFDEEYKKRGDRDNILRNIDEFNRKKQIESDLAKTYYKSISGDEARLIMRNDTIPFEGNEQTRIERMFRPRGRKYQYGPYEFEDDYNVYNGYVGTKPLYFARRNKGKTLASIIIWKLNEFYYLVGLGNKRTHIFFKCDQLDAVKFFIDKTVFEEE